MDFDHSLHDAYIESVSIGPRRELRLELALGSARISDGRLPEAATLRIGGIKNFEQARAFFARFGPVPIARIDRLAVRSRSGSSAAITLEIDPHGMVEVVCSTLTLTPPG